MISIAVPRTFLLPCMILGVSTLLSAQPSRQAVASTDSLLGATAKIEAAIRSGNLEEAARLAADLNSLLFNTIEQQRPTPTEKLATLERAVAGKSVDERFNALPDLATTAVKAAEWSKANIYATELLSLAPSYKAKWNYGTALHLGHTVIGQVALQRGDIQTARAELIASGQTPGSPTLSSFGPTFELAKSLLAVGARDAVSIYLSECAEFWKHDNGKIAQWVATIRGGGLPDFR